MNTEVSQGRFYVERDLSGRVRIECPPIVLVPPDVAVAMARAILEMAGVEVVFADPRQTVIRGQALRGNGNGKIIR